MGQAPDSAGAPLFRESPSQGGSSYWQGTYRYPVDEPGEDENPPKDGSISAAARRTYAVEALRQKDHVSAGLLAIFLGVFGIHKFYLGYNKIGFAMLAVTVIGGILTFGLAASVIWVISMIEGIIYLSKSQTDFDRVYVLNQRDWF